jgi:archaellum biogenesis ATPase FlaH
MTFGYIELPPSRPAPTTSAVEVEVCPALRSANQRLADGLLQPKQKELFGPVWHTGELGIFFGDTGSGKTILGVTLGDKLSRGASCCGMNNDNPGLVVLYIDNELTDRQFLRRYSDENGNLYSFSDKFFVDNLDLAAIEENRGIISFEKALFQRIEAEVKKIDAKVLIIDNITVLHSQTTQSTEVALELMRLLNQLKKELDISILVIAHTPKIDSSQPLSINSLAGSKHLSNFADSVFALGKSNQNVNYRYIKQVKPSRSAELFLHESNVLELEIKFNQLCLSMEFLGFGDEYQHLSRNTRNDSNGEMRSQAYDLHLQGCTLAEIAKRLLGNPALKGTVSKWLKKENQLRNSQSENTNEEVDTPVIAFNSPGQHIPPF